MKTSLVYRSPRGYDLVMRALYGRHYAARYQAVARLIPPRASVLELCCGPGFLYERYLRNRGVVNYTGLDINPVFIRRIDRLGGRGLLHDATRNEPLPAADYIIMQASLYQFLPDATPVVLRMLAVATVGVVIAEPVRNLATSGLPVVSSFARRATNAGMGATPARFSERVLDDFVAALPAQRLAAFLIPGGREKVYLLGKALVSAEEGDHQ